MKKTLILLMIAVVAAVTFTACEIQEKNKSFDQKQQEATQMIMEEAVKEVGTPAITNFQEMKTLKWIYELCDQENLICYAYLFNEREGKIGQYLGRCVGYGVPYSTQYVNPERVWMERDYMSVTGGNSYNDVGGTIPQPEPNGLFKPEGLSATWLIMIDEKTKEQRPVYIEPSIIVSPFKMH